MKRAVSFTKRNMIEMYRDPIIYIFCLLFPLAMLVLFVVINSFTNGNTPVFELKSLIPGLMMFSFTFVMLTLTLLVSKDKTTTFLKRLYTSPMKARDFLIGYYIPGFVIGILQAIICVFAGFILSLIIGEAYFNFGQAILLIVVMLPIMITFIFLGILFGTLLNDKSAPGISSVIISMSGILGGSWMPLDTMGKFETVCRFMPFYPSVYIGRVITGAYHSITDYTNPVKTIYSFDDVARLGIIPIVVFLVLSIGLCVFSFNKMMKSDKLK